MRTLVFFLLLSFIPYVQLHAQSGESPSQLPPEQAGRVLEILKDDTRRQELIATLEALDKANAKADDNIPLVDQLKAEFDTLGEQLGNPQFLLEAFGLSFIVLAALWVLFLIINFIRGCLDDWFGRVFASVAVQYRISKYSHIAFRLVKMILAFGAVILILQGWGADVMGLLETDFMGRLIASAFSIGLIVLTLLVVWELSSNAIDKALRESRTGDVIDQRRNTLLPLLKRIVKFVLVALGGLVILSELGVDIGPLLAGAGVLGLALGFGAQKMVQDFINGMFILLEDVIRLDDVVQVAGLGGLVERITIRTLILRDIDGRQHTIPWSTIDKVSNLTKTFSVALIECGVAYRENVQEVTKVLRQLCDEFKKHPDFTDHIIQEPEVDGVLRLDNSAVIIRVRFRTKPAKHWNLQRAFQARMKEVFDERGIEIPFPHQTIYFGQSKDGLSPPAAVELLGKPGGPEKRGKKPKKSAAGRKARARR